MDLSKNKLDTWGLYPQAFHCPLRLLSQGAWAWEEGWQVWGGSRHPLLLYADELGAP